MKFNCPHCGKAYDLPTVQEGRKVKCGKCAQSFVVQSAAVAQPARAIAAAVVNGTAMPPAGVEQPPAQPARCAVIIPPKPAKRDPLCQLCGGVMRKTSTGRSVLERMIIAFFALIIGGLLCATGVLMIPGIIISIAGLFWPSRRKKVLACVNCGAVVERK